MYNIEHRKQKITDCEHKKRVAVADGEALC